MAPQPDAMTFAVNPSAVSDTAISMTATTASDDTPPILYLFTNTVNGTVSGWSTGTVWTNTGLTSGVSYGYRVKARDAVSNETAWSGIETAVPVAAGFIYEPFDYAAGDVDGSQDDGIGFAGAGWTSTAFTSNPYDIAGSGLTFANHPTTGRAAARPSAPDRAEMHRAFSAGNQAALLADNTTIWISVLVNDKQFSGGNENGALVLGTGALTDPNPRPPLMAGGSGIGMAFDGEDELYALTIDGGSSVYSGTFLSTPGADNTYLIVGKISWAPNGGNDTIRLFNMATAADGPPADGDAFATATVDLDQTVFDTIAIGNAQVSIIDEIRISKTYHHVMPAANRTIFLVR